MRRLAILAIGTLALMSAPVPQARATDDGDLVDMVDTLLPEESVPLADYVINRLPTVPNDLCVRTGTGRRIACLEVAGQRAEDGSYVAYTHLCVYDEWVGAVLPWYMGGEVGCGYTTYDWGYVSSTQGACVEVNDLPSPAACVNGHDQCLLVVLGGTRISCDHSA